MRGGSREGAGRPKGSQNHLTMEAKEAIALAAEALGGHERLVTWAKEDPTNERMFWGSIYTKLVAQSVKHSGDPDGGPIEIREILIRGVDAADDRPSPEGA
jgi:hypothetical protein